MKKINRCVEIQNLGKITNEQKDNKKNSKDMVNTLENLDARTSKQQVFQKHENIGGKKKLQRNNARKFPRMKVVNFKIESCSAK